MQPIQSIKNMELTKSDRNRISRERTKELKLVLSDLLELTLGFACDYLELIAVQQPERLAEAFKNAIGPHDCAKMAIDILSEGRRSFIEGIYPRIYGFELRDLFYCLSPETQSKLKSQGVYYDSFV